jgi:hypothetical protein
MIHTTRFAFAKRVSFGILTLAMICSPILAQEPAGTSGGTTVLYVQTTSVLSTNSQVFAPISGLTFSLPAASSSAKFATITLSMPNLYLTAGTPGQTAGAGIGILLNGSLVALGQISGDVAVGTTGATLDGRKPATVIVKVALGSTPITVDAAWGGTRNTTINSDTFASMSALLSSK